MRNKCQHKGEDTLPICTYSTQSVALGANLGMSFRQTVIVSALQQFFLQWDGNVSLLAGWSTTLVHELLCRHSRGPQRMNPDYFGDPRSFPLVPPADQGVH